MRAGEKCSEAFASLLCISVTTAHVMSVFYERENYTRRERERERGAEGLENLQMLNVHKMKYYYVQRMCIVCTHYSLRVVQHDVLGCRCTPAQFELYSVRFFFFFSLALRCVRMLQPQRRLRVQFMSVIQFILESVHESYFLSYTTLICCVYF